MRVYASAHEWQSKDEKSKCERRRAEYDGQSTTSMVFNTTTSKAKKTRMRKSKKNGCLGTRKTVPNDGFIVSKWHTVTLSTTVRKIECRTHRQGGRINLRKRLPSE